MTVDFFSSYHSAPFCTMNNTNTTTTNTIIMNINSKRCPFCPVVLPLRPVRLLNSNSIMQFIVTEGGRPLPCVGRGVQGNRLTARRPSSSEVPSFTYGVVGKTDFLETYGITSTLAERDKREKSMFPTHKKKGNISRTSLQSSVALTYHSIFLIVPVVMVHIILVLCSTTTKRRKTELRADFSRGCHKEQHDGRSNLRFTAHIHTPNYFSCSVQ